MNVLYIYSDSEKEWNCSEWRCQTPSDAINRTGIHHSKMVSITDCIKGKCHDEMSWADIIILQRNMFGGVLGFVFHWRAYGKVIVLDIDDAYDLMPSHALAAPFWRNGIGKLDGKDTPLAFKPFEHMEYGARLVNAMTMPSAVLAKRWEKLAPVYIVPNYPNLEPYLKERPPAIPTSRPIVGWGGSWSHIDSFLNSNVIPAIRRLMEQEKVRCVVAGGDDRMPGALRLKGLETFPWVKFKDWPATIKSFTVGLAPLAGDIYDRCRSDIKALDYMACKIPWVATDDAPYQHLREYGTLVKNQAKYWEEAITQALRKPDQDQIQRGYEYAMKQNIDLNIDKVIATYQKIIDEGRTLL